MNLTNFLRFSIVLFLIGFFFVFCFHIKFPDRCWWCLFLYYYLKFVIKYLNIYILALSLRIIIIINILKKKKLLYYI